MVKNWIVVTTDYATNRIIAAYGPMTEAEAGNLSMALPASSTRDHAPLKLSQTPTFNFADGKKAVR